jgi:hypothetical protein
VLRCHRSSTAQLLRPSFPRPRGRACLQPARRRPTSVSSSSSVAAIGLTFSFPRQKFLLPIIFRN